MDGVWSLDGEGGTRKTMNQDRIWQRAVFLVWSERAERRWQGERFECARRMGQIFVAMLGEFVPEKRDSYCYGAIGKFQ